MLSASVGAGEVQAALELELEIDCEKVLVADNGSHLIMSETQTLFFNLFT